MWKTPLYVRIDKDATGKPYLGMAGALPMSHIPNTMVVLKMELELDETIFSPAFDTQTTVKVTRGDVDMSAVVAGLKQIDKDVKDI